MRRRRRRKNEEEEEEEKDIKYLEGEVQVPAVNNILNRYPVKLKYTPQTFLHCSFVFFGRWLNDLSNENYARCRRL